MRVTQFGDYLFTATGVIAGEIDDSDQSTGGLIAIPGASGAFDRYGSDAAPLQTKTVKADFWLERTDTASVDALLDAFLQAAHQGTQWLRVLMGDGTTRRGWARCTQIGKPHVYGASHYLKVSATFEMADPYWYADTQTTDTFVVGATPTVCDLNNLGTAPLVKAILSFVGTCNRPKFTNNTNGYSIELNRNISSSGTVQIDLGAQTITYNGADDFALAVLPNTQIGMFQWDVGANDVDFSAAGGGTPIGTVQITYRVSYH
jgi:hypothetical protein